MFIFAHEHAHLLCCFAETTAAAAVEEIEGGVAGLKLRPPNSLDVKKSTSSDVISVDELLTDETIVDGGKNKLPGDQKQSKSELVELRHLVGLNNLSLF